MSGIAFHRASTGLSASGRRQLSQKFFQQVPRHKSSIIRNRPNIVDRRNRGLQRPPRLRDHPIIDRLSANHSFHTGQPQRNRRNRAQSNP